jgi:dihydrofolate synthase/folylpolyglutamate synthase
VNRPTTLAGWLAYVETQHPRAIAMGLDRVRDVASRMAISIACPVVTVGGTNGKGSTCAMLDAILVRAGHRTGVYTSPHLLRYNERVRIAGEPRADSELVEAFNAVEDARAGTPLTYFEYGTLGALWLFSRASLDGLILEVGLGGRLDAVNAIDADTAVVTSVDIDHVEYLGPTREDIGREKAGIFRAGRPAICGDRDPPDTLVAHASAIGATLMLIGRDFDCAADSPMQWRYRGPGGNRYGLPMPALRGRYQLANAASALAAIDTLRDRLPVSASDVRDGLVGVELRGRFQVLPGRPVTVLDVAHNPQAARALAATLGDMGFHPRTHAVLGMFSDKDIVAVARTLAPRIDRWHVGPLPGPRGASAARVRDALVEAGVDADAVSMHDDIEHAYAAARSDADEADRIVVFGSFLTVAAALAAAGGSAPTPRHG